MLYTFRYSILNPWVLGSDYILPDGTPGSVRHSLSSSLPEGSRGLGEPRNQDFLPGPVDPNRPFILVPPSNK